MHPLHRFRKNHEGTTIIEFAIVAPVLFLLLIGFIELGLILFASSIIEDVTNAGARPGLTGLSPNGTDHATYIRAQIVTLSGGILDPNKLNIAFIPPNAANGNVTTYKVDYQWKLFTPLIGSLLGDASGVYLIKATSSYRDKQPIIPPAAR